MNTIDMLRFSATRAIMPPPRTVRKLCQVRDLIRDCLEEELSLADLSLEADLSAWHLLRAFRQSFGETPKAYLTRLRLERAKELLTISTRSVTEICFDLGFSSLGSFSTLFHRRVGLSPADFRRRVRAWVTVPGRQPWAYVPLCFGHHFRQHP
jgi:transcriptional regulator GlxA family with amidase domain